MFILPTKVRQNFVPTKCWQFFKLSPPLPCYNGGFVGEGGCRNHDTRTLMEAEQHNKCSSQACLRKKQQQQKADSNHYLLLGPVGIFNDFA